MILRYSFVWILAGAMAAILPLAGPLHADTRAVIDEQTAKSDASAELSVKEHLERVTFLEGQAAKLLEEAAGHRQKAEDLKNRPIPLNYKSGIYRQPDRHLQKARQLEMQAAQSKRMAQEHLNLAMRGYLADALSAVD